MYPITRTGDYPILVFFLVRPHMSVLIHRADMIIGVLILVYFVSESQIQTLGVVGFSHYLNIDIGNEAHSGVDAIVMCNAFPQGR